MRKPPKPGAIDRLDLRPDWVKQAEAVALYERAYRLARANSMTMAFIAVVDR